MYPPFGFFQGSGTSMNMLEHLPLAILVNDEDPHYQASCTCGNWDGLSYDIALWGIAGARSSAMLAAQRHVTRMMELKNEDTNFRSHVYPHYDEYTLTDPETITPNQVFTALKKWFLGK